MACAVSKKLGITCRTPRRKINERIWPKRTQKPWAPAGARSDYVFDRGRGPSKAKSRHVSVRVATNCDFDCRLRSLRQIRTICTSPTTSESPRLMLLHRPWDLIAHETTNGRSLPTVG